VDRVKVTERRHLACELLVALPDTDGLLVTTAVQTLLDCGRSLPLVEAVVLFDSALRACDVTVTELRRAARSLPGRRDAARVRRVLALCDPDSGSVLETVLRVRMLLDGIEGFSTQLTLRDAAGRHVHRADFCFEAARLVVEVDGEKWHQDVARDRIRDNQLAALGWRVLRYRWAEVVHNPSAVLLEVRAAAALGISDCQSGADQDAAAA
jgi:very-short-patch-repair endonuclease